MALKNSFLFLFLCAVAFLFCSGAPRVEERPEYVPLTKVIEGFDFDYKFFSTTGTLEIGKGDNTLTFLIETNEVHGANGRIIYLKERMLLQEEQLLISADGVDLVIKHLLKRGLPWEYVDDTFIVYDGSRAVKVSRPEQRGREPYVKRSYDYEIRTIIIDPGHGGKDPGGIGSNSIREKDIVLDVAKELKRELKRRFRNREIVITREEDAFVSLEDRGKLANRTDPRKNPIYISIHANISFTSNTRGYESYFLSLEPFNEDARDVASMENSVLGFEIENHNDYLREIINRIVDIEYRRESMQLAELIQKNMEMAVGTESINRGVKSAFFYVLKGVKMPSVLVEIGFLTNGEEAFKMQKSEYKKKIAKGIADGIDEFITIFNKTDGFTK